MTGVIFDLKRFAIHDGGGLRSTLFLKGCPLRCPWCQNPEGLEIKKSILYNPKKCLGCERCVAVCKNGALKFLNRVHINHKKCNLCVSCVDVCPGAALEILGKEITAGEAANMMLRDKVFFGSKGGVTLSGGECLKQWEFSAEVLRLCKKEGVDTAIETSLMASREAVDAMIPVTDHFIIDIKIFNSSEHKRIIGVDNAPILGNFEYLTKQNADVLVRTPLIPGFTAFEKNIREICRYILGVNRDVNYELLNFNPLCKSKYSAMEKKYPIDALAYTDEEMNSFYNILKDEGVTGIVKERKID